MLKRLKNYTLKNGQANKLIRSKIIIMALVSASIVFLAIYIPVEIKTQSLEKKVFEYRQDMEVYTNSLERYTSIKSSLEHNFYTEKEISYINEALVDIENLMIIDKTEELKSKIDDLEKYIEDINNPLIVSSRATLYEIMNIDSSWLTDAEREVLNSKKDDVQRVYNSEDVKNTNAKIGDLNLLVQEYKDLVDKRKNDSRSIKVTEASYIKGILIVNKHFALPSNYNYGEDKEARNALNIMKADARKEGINLRELSGFRSYNTQKQIFARNVAQQGEYNASMYSARAGESEHQAGVAFDLGGRNTSTDLLESFGDTEEGIWLRENCAKYGFILRYMKGKEDITGYAYEPWHFRYVGVEHSTKIMEEGITLEEYLGLYPY